MRTCGRFFSLNLFLIALFLSLSSGRATAAETVLILDSQPGDKVGGGVRRKFTPTDGTFRVQPIGEAIHVGFSARQWWHLVFQPPIGQAIEERLYDGAYRFGTSFNPRLDVGGNGRGCHTLTGRFHVLEHVRTPEGGIERLAIDFEQRCDGRTGSLFGAVRINSDVPVIPRISVSDLVVRKGNRGRTTAHVVFSLSMPSNDVQSGYFTTRDGSAQWARDYILRGGIIRFNPRTTVRVIPVRILGNLVPTGNLDFHVDLRSTTSEIGKGSARVVIQDPNVPTSIVAMNSEPGDYIGQGKRWSFTPLDSAFLVESPNGRGTSLRLNRGITGGGLVFKVAGQTLLLPGVYDNVQRSADDALGIHGMDVILASRACSALGGRFEVHQAEYDAQNKPQALSIDFEQHCENREPALFGAVRVNAILQQASISDTVGKNGRARFLITLNPPSHKKERVTFTTVDGTARAGIDYEAVTRTLVFQPGQTRRRITVPLLPGATGGRQFFGELSATTLPLWINRSIARIRKTD